MLIFLEILFGVAAMSFAGTWLSMEALRPYTLQAFAAAFVIYIILKKVAKDGLFYTRSLENLSQVYKGKKDKKIPIAQIISLAILAFAVTLLVGFLGGLHTGFFGFTFVYIFFLAFSTEVFTTFALTLFMLGVTFFVTPDITSHDFTYPILALVFMSVVMLAKKYYDQSVIKQHVLKLESEKVAYYNIYAENQLNESLKTQKRLRELSKSGENTKEFVKEIIIIVDELAKKSRFSENQMVVSQELSKMSLNLRHFQTGLDGENKVKSTDEKNTT